VVSAPAARDWRLTIGYVLLITGDWPLTTSH